MLIRLGVQGAREAEDTLDRLGGKVSSFGRFAATAAGTMTGFLAAAGVLNVVSGAFDAARGSVIGFNDLLDRARVGFTTMLGSAEAADAHLRQLAAFARTTPFEFPELVQASQRLQAMGFSAADVIPTLKAVGDAVAAAGGGSAMIESVTRALGQMGTAGRVNAQDMLQLTSAGIPAWQILADSIGVTTAEVRKMSEQGLIPADVALKALIEGMERRAPDAMSKMATTWMGAVSNIKDSLQQGIATAMRPWFDLLREGAVETAAFLQTERFGRFAAMVQSTMAASAESVRALFRGVADGNVVIDQMRERWGVLGREILSGLLNVANGVAPAISEVLGFLGSMADAAVGWGFNLIASYAQGMLDAAGSFLAGVMQAIGDAIAQFIASFSPPKKGPLSQVQIWGANLLSEYFKGMAAADFSILDSVLGGVRDAIQTQLSKGQIDQTAVIPNLIGAQAVIATAIQQWREYGSVTEEVFGDLARFLGDASGQIQDLVRDALALAATERELSAIEREIEGWEDALRDAERAFRDSIRPLEDAADAWSRYFDRQIEDLEQTITLLQRQISLRERLLDPDLSALSQEEAELRVLTDRNRLREAENAHLERARKIREDIAKLDERAAGETADRDRALGNLQRDTQQRLAGVTDPRRRAEIEREASERAADIRQRSEQSLARIARDRGELEGRLARESIQTDEDRLAIAQARIRLARDEAEVRKLTDPELAAWRETVKAATDRRDVLQIEKDQIVGPLLRQIEDMRSAHEAQVRLIEDQLETLRRQREEIVEQRDAQKAAVQLALDRLSHERAVADMIAEQGRLLDSLIEKEAGLKGGAGGAGGLGDKLAGLAGGGSLAGVASGIKVPNLTGGPDLTKFREEFEANLAARRIELDARIAEQAAELKETVAREFSQAMADAWKDPRFESALIGGAAGYFIGGPFGAAIGAVIASAYANALDKHVDFVALKAKWDEFTGRLALQWTLDKERLGNIFGAIGDYFRDDNTLVGFAVELGQSLVNGVVEGAGKAWDALQTWISDRFAGIVTSLKTYFRISSPSDLMAEEIGGPLIDGALKGAQDKLESLLQFFRDLPGNILAAIGSTAATLYDRGTDLLTGLIDGIRFVWTGVVSPWFAALSAESIAAVGAVTDTLAQKGRDLIDGLLSGAKEKWDGVGGAAAWLKGTGLRVVGDMGSQLRTLYDSGKDIIQGLIDGMAAMFPNVINKAKEIARGIIEEIRSNGRSPWPAMIESGKDAMQGLEIGIDRGGPAAVKKVDEYGQKMIESADALIDWFEHLRPGGTADKLWEEANNRAKGSGGAGGGGAAQSMGVSDRWLRETGFLAAQAEIANKAWREMMQASSDAVNAIGASLRQQGSGRYGSEWTPAQIAAQEEADRRHAERIGAYGDLANKVNAGLITQDEFREAHNRWDAQYQDTARTLIKALGSESRDFTKQELEDHDALMRANHERNLALAGMGSGFGGGGYDSARFRNTAPGGGYGGYGAVPPQPAPLAASVGPTYVLVDGRSVEASVQRRLPAGQRRVLGGYG